jgi:hypothetical protein
VVGGSRDARNRKPCGSDKARSRSIPGIPDATAAGFLRTQASQGELPKSFVRSVTIVETQELPTARRMPLVSGSGRGREAATERREGFYEDGCCRLPNVDTSLSTHLVIAPTSALSSGAQRTSQHAAAASEASGVLMRSSTPVSYARRGEQVAPPRSMQRRQMATGSRVRRDPLFVAADYWCARCDSKAPFAAAIVRGLTLGLVFGSLRPR